jgi:GNAT superfamily N-acetyltransferase
VATVEVRAAQMRDLGALVQLYTELADGDRSTAPGDLESSRAALEAIHAQSGRHLLVGLQGEDVVGTADLVVVPNLTHGGTPWGIVENVVVASSARRQGVARALFAEIEDIARAAGCHKIGLLSGKHRAEAHAFYEQVGYRPVAEGFKLYFDR